MKFFGELLHEKKPTSLEFALKDLTTNRPEVSSFVRSMMQQGRLQFKMHEKTGEAMTAFMPQPDGKTTYAIDFGTMNVVSEVFNRITFNGESFSPKERSQYKLLHEITHVFLNELKEKKNPIFLDLLETCKRRHERDKLYFTGLASSKARQTGPAKFQDIFHRSQSIVPAYEEDATELMAMALWDKVGFLQYLKYLIDPKNKTTLNQVGVRSLDIGDSVAVEFAKRIIELTNVDASA